ncbi:LysR family transcriptional regulator [Planktotalea sp.]|uniref:LysR family transcriptional regulator n=1 Tax=Planktotalea sp. TaxID=2029877 RepID=UPI003D6BCA1D
MTGKPRRSNLPPLNALRAFETVARLGSFTSAADELCVTPAAISQQVKSLESWLGLSLFDRHAQGVSLTDAGRQAVPDLTRAFDQMIGSVFSLMRAASPERIRIATLPSIAHFWLSPRLSALRKAIPNLEISLTTRLTPPNLQREPFEFSLFLAEPHDDGRGFCLAEDEIFPVCAPELAMRLKAPSDLMSETLLNDETWIDDWTLWASAAGGDLQLGKSGPVFSLFGLALEEAKNGAGVLMGHRFLVEEHLRRGELVAPFPERVLRKEKLFLEVGPKADGDPVVRKIVELLVHS